VQWKRDRWVRVSVPLPRSYTFFDSVAVSVDGEAWAPGQTYIALPSGRTSKTRLLMDHYVPCQGRNQLGSSTAVAGHHR